VQVSSLELLGRRAVGGHEPGEAFVEVVAHGLARRVEERGRRLLQPFGAVRRVLSQDRPDSERLGTRPLPGCGGVLFDLSGHVGDALLVGFWGEVLPAGERREGHGLGGGVAETVGVLPFVAGEVLLGAVEPGAGEGLAVCELPDGLETGPLAEAETSTPSL
jgi:hypothetical protein